MLLGGIAVLILTVAGIMASVIHNPLLAIVFMFIGLIVAAFALRLDLINNGSKHRNANWACAGIVAADCVLSGCVFCVIHVSNPSPHLSFAIIAKPDIWLTNESFVVKGAYHSTNFLGTVVVPVKPQQTDAKLIFAVVNDRDETEARSADVIFIADKSLSVTPEITLDLKWHGANFDGVETDDQNWQAFVMAVPGPLQAHDVYELPFLEFKNVENRLDNPTFARVIMKGTGIPKTELAFWLVFWRATNMEWPKLVSPKSMELSSNGLYGKFEFDDK